MIGKLTKQELSDELLQLINTSGNSGILTCKKAMLTSTEQGQKVFTLPFDLNYDIDDIPIITINTVFLPDEKYLLDSSSLTIIDDEGVAKDSKIRIMLLSISNSSTNHIEPYKLYESNTVYSEQRYNKLDIELDKIYILLLNGYTEINKLYIKNNTLYGIIENTGIGIIAILPIRPEKNIDHKVLINGKIYSIFINTKGELSTNITEKYIEFDIMIK